MIQDSSATAAWTASDTGAGLAAPASGTVALATGAVGTFTVGPPEVRDRVGHVAPAASCSYRVIYDWTGFLDPVSNGRRTTRWTPARSSPVMWSLNGDRGLGVLAGEPDDRLDELHGQREDVLGGRCPRRGPRLRYFASTTLPVAVPHAGGVAQDLPRAHRRARTTARRTRAIFRFK